jgi:pimeloyl-ACP methyl ester carboxylesterase
MSMRKVPVTGAELDVDVRGEGEAVVFLHGVGLCDSFLPLVDEPVLSEEYRTIRYRRRGYGGNSMTSEPLSITQQAEDCLAVLEALGVDRAHVVGHSYDGCIALQLAMDAPEALLSLGLFEPVLFNVRSADELAGAVSPLVQRYMKGERTGVVDDFFRVVDGADWRAEVERAVPGGPALAEKDIATLFECDLPSTVGWQVRPRDFGQPVLYLLGSESMAMFSEGRDLIRTWLPQTETSVLWGANHLLQMRRPADAAAQLVAFLKRHPFTS